MCSNLLGEMIFERKRRLQTIDENGDKKIRREFKCFFCSQHFRTESSLERHKRAIHTPPIRTEKRKGMELDPTTDTYVKRQKGDPKKAIQYSNYFWNKYDWINFNFLFAARENKCLYDMSTCKYITYVFELWDSFLC